MPDSNARTQITVAIIGLIGVVATAVIANWDKFKKPDPNRSNSARESNMTPGMKKPSDPPSANPKPNAFGNEPDAVEILDATQQTGAHLLKGQETQFTVTVHYRLTSLKQATLSVGLVEYPEVKGCQGQGNIPVSGQAPATRGEHTVSIPITWKVGVSKTVVTNGSIGYTASFWSDIQSRQLFRSFGSLPGYCYSFE